MIHRIAQGYRELTYGLRGSQDQISNLLCSTCASARYGTMAPLREGPLEKVHYYAYTAAKMSILLASRGLLQGGSLSCAPAVEPMIGPNPTRAGGSQHGPTWTRMGVPCAYLLLLVELKMTLTKGRSLEDFAQAFSKPCPANFRDGVE
jgi:hypothetical protein